MLGLTRGLGLSRAQQRGLVQEAARLGFASLWTPAGLTGRSIFQICREWWEATTDIVPEGLRVGTSVIPVPGTSVVSLAAESATLNELTGGKFALGIGLGGYPSESLRTQLGLPLVGHGRLCTRLCEPTAHPVPGRGRAVRRRACALARREARDRGPARCRCTWRRWVRACCGWRASWRMV